MRQNQQDELKNILLDLKYETFKNEKKLANHNVYVTDDYGSINYEKTAPATYNRDVLSVHPLYSKLTEDPSIDIIRLIQKFKHDKVDLRVAPSLQSCRFTLPIDLQKLENMTPFEYINKYCEVLPHRLQHLKRIFRLYEDHIITDSFDRQSLAEAVQHFYTNELSKDRIVDLFEFFPDLVYSNWTLPYYAVVVCFSERLFFDDFSTENTKDDATLLQDVNEYVEFEFLERKLNIFDINPLLRKMLKIIARDSFWESHKDSTYLTNRCYE
ncbi:hypothetical protein SNEBB_008623 [Seison nebaliae]|nr:hypothetical protein SNEBB_008623 [Seison nebaliae]